MPSKFEHSPNLPLITNLILIIILTGVLISIFEQSLHLQLITFLFVIVLISFMPIISDFIRTVDALIWLTS